MQQDNSQLILQSLQEIKSDLREFKIDVNRKFEQVDQRFEYIDRQLEQINKQFEQVNKQFEQVDRRFEQFFSLLKEEKRDREKMEDKLEKVYEARNQVTVSFTRAFAFGNAGFAAFIAFIVAMFVSK